MNNETKPVVADGPAEGIATCKYCDLPIRETHMGHVRNEWEHLNGLSFCDKSSNWAWPKSSPVEPAAPVVQPKETRTFYENSECAICNAKLCNKKSFAIPAGLAGSKQIVCESCAGQSQPAPVVVPEKTNPETTQYEAAGGGLPLQTGDKFYPLDNPYPGLPKPEVEKSAETAMEQELYESLSELVDAIEDSGGHDENGDVFDITKAVNLLERFEQRKDKPLLTAQPAPVVVRPEETPKKILGDLVNGIQKWAAQEDGVPDWIAPSFVQAITTLGWSFTGGVDSEALSLVLTAQPAPLPSDQLEAILLNAHGEYSAQRDVWMGKECPSIADGYVNRMREIEEFMKTSALPSDQKETK